MWENLGLAERLFCLVILLLEDQQSKKLVHRRCFKLQVIFTNKKSAMRVLAPL